MDNLNDHKRRAATFKSEALKLKQLNYINDATFNTIKQAYEIRIRSNYFKLVIIPITEKDERGV